MWHPNMGNGCLVVGPQKRFSATPPAMQIYRYTKHSRILHFMTLNIPSSLAFPITFPTRAVPTCISRFRFSSHVTIPRICPELTLSTALILPHFVLSSTLYFYHYVSYSLLYWLDLLLSPLEMVCSLKIQTNNESRAYHVMWPQDTLTQFQLLVKFTEWTCKFGKTQIRFSLSSFITLLSSSSYIMKCFYF